MGFCYHDHTVNRAHRSESSTFNVLSARAHEATPLDAQQGISLVSVAHTPGCDVESGLWQIGSNYMENLTALNICVCVSCKQANTYMFTGEATTTTNVQVSNNVIREQWVSSNNTFFFF